MTTNGTMITEEIAKKIVDSGLSHLHFSIDGLEQANDFVRGVGIFRKAIRSVELLNKEKQRCNRVLSIGIACIIMNHSLEDLSKLLEFADTLNINVINFQPLVKDNTDMRNRCNTEFWVSEKRLPILERSIKEIKNFKREHINIYENPKLELYLKYYKRNLSSWDWKCFGGYKTLFICPTERGPSVHTCHGICGYLRETSLKGCWFSKEAKRLRKSAKRCTSLCLQACHSRIESESLVKLFRKYWGIS